MSLRRLFTPLTVLALLAAGCGGGDDATESGARTVNVEMIDIAFKPTTIAVTKGETVRFVFKNKGKVAHDAYIGDADEQIEHEEEMRKAGDDGGHGGHGSGEANAITVDPGETGELTYTFDEVGTLEIGCHQPGHYDAGMKIALDVS